MTNIYQPIIDEALRLATEGHEGQVRWDKSPYIVHPKRVSIRAEERFRKYVSISGANWPNLEKMAAIVNILGKAHDLNEDVERYRKDPHLFVRQLMAFDVGNIFSKEDYDAIQISLEVLNKHNHANYLEFVLAAKENFFASFVKVADIEDNLSDLAKGSMKDKYLLALYVLLAN